VSSRGKRGHMHAAICKSNKCFIEYCFGSTAEMDVESYWKDLYACSSFLPISSSSMSIIPKYNITSQYSPVGSPITSLSFFRVVSSALDSMLAPNLSVDHLLSETKLTFKVTD
jgi:hypothetical protein